MAQKNIEYLGLFCEDIRFNFFVTFPVTILEYTWVKDAIAISWNFCYFSSGYFGVQLCEICKRNILDFFNFCYISSGYLGVHLGETHQSNFSEFFVTFLVAKVLNI